MDFQTEALKPYKMFLNLLKTSVKMRPTKITKLSWFCLPFWTPRMVRNADPPPGNKSSKSQIEQRPNKDEPKQIREESKAAQGEASQTLEETKQAKTGPRRVKSGSM